MKKRVKSALQGISAYGTACWGSPRPMRSCQTGWEISPCALEGEGECCCARACSGSGYTLHFRQADDQPAAGEALFCFMDVVNARDGRPPPRQSTPAALPGLTTSSSTSDFHSRSLVPCLNFMGHRMKLEAAPALLHLVPQTRNRRAAGAPYLN